MDSKRSVCVLHRPSLCLCPWANAALHRVNKPPWRTVSLKFPGVSISAQDIVTAQSVLRVARLWTHTHNRKDTVDLLISLGILKADLWAAVYVVFKARPFNLSADLAVVCAPPPPASTSGRGDSPADDSCNKSHVEWLRFTVDSTLMCRSVRRWRLSEEAAVHK